MGIWECAQLLKHNALCRKRKSNRKLYENSPAIDSHSNEERFAPSASSHFQKVVAYPLSTKKLYLIITGPQPRNFCCIQLRLCFSKA
jgi:hypothetical protein